MKPPSRRRTEPSRFRPKSTEESPTASEKQAVSVRSFCRGWTRREQRSFLQGLKQQKNFASELDLTELQKKVPRRSLEEIEDLIKLLKSRVQQMVFQQVQSQLREERANKVPIENWGELVNKISGPHEKTISSAFSQTFVVAATEPRSLLNSIPPQAIGVPTPTRPSHPVPSHPVPLRPKPTTQLFPSVPSTIPIVTALPTQIHNTAQSSIDTSSTSRASTSSACSSLVQPACSSSAVEQANKSQPSASCSVPPEPSTPQTSQQESSQVTISPGQMKAEQVVANSLSAMSIGSVAPSVSMASDTENPARSEMEDRDSEHRPRVLKCIVNFDKIYEYLSDPDSKPCNSALTSMECAVLLDLLMSLPEELPLLDCKQLQHHLLEVHRQLTKPAQNPASSSKTSQNISAADSAEVTKQGMTAPESSCPPEEPSGDSSITEPAKEKDWDSVGMRPLNPLLIPVDLLKRRSVDSVNDTSSVP